MTPINKGIGVFALSMMSAAAFGQQPASIEMQDITSKIAVTYVDGKTVVQQVGSPFGAPVLVMGDDVLYQGLFGALTQVSSGTVGIGSIFGDNDNYELAFDAAVKALRVKIPAGETAKIFIVDMSGATVVSENINDKVGTIDLSSLTPGIYMAGTASDNKFSKTLKFILK